MWMIFDTNGCFIDEIHSEDEFLSWYEDNHENYEGTKFALVNFKENKSMIAEITVSKFSVTLF
jgi:hypothetical protein